MTAKKLTFTFMKKIYFILLFLGLNLSAQQMYDVVILPKNFSLFNGENRYDLDKLVKSFFESEGFKVYSESEILPETIAYNRCGALTVDVYEKNALMVTKVYVEIKNCKNEVLLVSDIGDSRQKAYLRAYNEALRKALESLKGNTKFSKSSSDFITEATVSNTKYTDKTLFAIPTQTGYKLVDDVPNVIFELTKSSSPEIFMAKKGNLQGLFVKKESNWFFEYNNGDQLVSEKVEVKF